MVDHLIKPRGDLVDEIILNVELQIAANAAERTGGGDDSIRLDHDNSPLTMRPAPAFAAG
jgi:hypothetical protein